MKSHIIAIMVLSLLLAGSISALIININPEKFNKDNSKYVIPDWVKHNADWWSKDLMTDEEFSYTMQYLINEGIIKIEACDGRCVDEEGIE